MTNDTDISQDYEPWGFVIQALLVKQGSVWYIFG